MENHIEQATQYAQSQVLYKTIIYFNTEQIKKEQNIEELKKKESKNVS